MRIIAAQLSSCIWVEGKSQEKYTLPLEIVQRIQELERKESELAFHTSTERVQETRKRRVKRVSVLQELLQEAQQSQLIVERELVERDFLGQNTKPDNMQIGTWECPTSPLSVCVYDIEQDPYCDQCLFCEDPSERK